MIIFGGVISAAMLFSAAAFLFVTPWPSRSMCVIGGIVLVFTGVAVLVEDVGLWRARRAEQRLEQQNQIRPEGP